MPYKVKDFTPISKSDNIELVNFFSLNGDITNIYLNDQNDKLVKKILLGKVKNKSGRYRIDDIDVINKRFVKRKVEYIKQDNWIQRLAPTRAVLVLSLFFDLNFLKKARVNYAEKKYDYLSLVDSKNDLTDLKVRNEINKGIEKFLKFNIDNYKKLNKNIIKQTTDLNQKKSDFIFEDFPPQVRVLAKAIFDTETELKINRNLLKFNQVIFDKIQLMNELRDSCACEYNSKRANNELLKKKAHLFKFKQTKYIVAKQAKFLAININEIRLKTLKLLFNKNEFKKQLKFELKKFYKSHSVSKQTIQKVSSELSIWQKVIDDIFLDHNKSETIFVFDFIERETNLLKDHLISTIHNGYHKLIFTAEIEYGNKNEFAALKKHYKKKVTPVFNQSFNAINRTTKRLELNFEWFLKSSFKLSSLNIIYSKILKAINMGKKNIVISNFLQLLTVKDLKALMQAIEKVNEYYSEVSFIILHSKLKTLVDLQPNKTIFTIINKEMKNIKISELMQNKYLQIFDEELFASNKIEFVRSSDKLVKTEDRLWNIKVNKKISRGFILINPFQIKTSFIEEKALPVNLKIVKNSRFSDTNIYCGITSKKTRIFFYDQNNKYEKDQKVTIYLQEKAIINIINKENEDE